MSTNLPSQSGKTPSKVCFVGNIPYDVTEEQLIEVFNEVGPVVQFRLVVDRDTGRAKGYGFCEYPDQETASSAVRNLNNYEVNGRQIRVDYAEMDSIGGTVGGTSTNSTTKSSSRLQQQSQQPNLQSLHHKHSQYPSMQSATDAITAILGSMNANQLFDLMTQMKILVNTNPEQARSLLTSNPQLSYALFQAMIIMNAITPAIIHVSFLFVNFSKFYKMQCIPNRLLFPLPQQPLRPLTPRPWQPLTPLFFNNN